MDPKIIKKTKDSMGTIIKKPPLTDKLLNKPPFRFLHDIITEVIRTSGFLKGLFTNEEMESKNVTAKEDKLLFLQKVIDCVNIVSGDTLTVKPNKVIAGHEPEKTNELLQVMAKCILKNKSSTDAVQQVLTGKSSKSKSKEKPPSGSKRSEIGEKDEKEDTGKERKKKGDRSSEHRDRKGHEEPSVTSRKLTRPPNADPMQPEEHTHVPNGSQLDDGEEHGGLVRKILETKKELEQSAAGQNKAEKHTEIQRTNVTTAQQRKERELVVKEIDQLRNSVQTLCQSATPLAKIIDYIQEDMDAMQNELVFWKKENAEHATKLKEEENITARAVEPLKHELEELDRSLSTYRNQMAATKANIIRNQEKIQKMVSAVAA
uniref:TRAF3-interacting protein 1 n=1 Tax=Ciona savignyi TaxID=51511 RepID=H2YVY1_CIOSA